MPPDYARVVGISTRSARKELIPLATIAILTPLLVGMVLQVEALGGFLVSLIVAPIIVQYCQPRPVGWLIVVILFAGLVWGIAQSKKPIPKMLPADRVPHASSPD